MKFNFKVLDFQTDAVDAVVGSFLGQGFHEGLSYVRDLGLVEPKEEDQFKLKLSDDELQDFDPENDTGFKNEEIKLSDEALLKNIQTIQAENNIKQSTSLVKKLGSCNLDIDMETGERVIIVTGCINALLSRVSKTFIKNNSCIA
ncbi:MAG: hypothetical protein GX345_07815 [Clostridiales bacterium]|nr:hypothetical protein [Clostridiales bacterium]